MYAVFYKDLTKNETELRFRGLLQNGKTDIFFKNASIRLGWNIANTKVFEYDDTTKFTNFVNHMSDNDKKNIIWCDIETGTLSSAIITKDKNVYEGNLPADDSKATDYYTQEQLNQYDANKATVDQWIIDNPEPDENTPEVVLPYPNWQEYYGLIVKNEMEFEILDSINGTLFDINDRIALEEAAITAGKKKLD